MNLEYFYGSDNYKKNKCPSKSTEILPACKRIIVIGDIHGDWEVTKKIFLRYELIDTNGRWIAEPLDTKVVQVGDIVDRGGRPDSVGDECSELKIMDFLDEILTRPELMYTMYLEPGDMQIINNYRMFHSRTGYLDYENDLKKRCLYRLWLSPPDSIKLPESWKDFYRSVEPSMVRGGIIGQSYDEICIDFDKTHSKFLNMKIDAS